MTEPQRKTIKRGDVLAEREKGIWQTIYPPEARSLIRTEIIYLAVHIAVGLGALGIIWWFPLERFLEINATNFFEFQGYVVAWLGGILGGTTFSMKWLYHALAKGRWHQDRRVWRFFTPHISGVVAVAFLALLDSGFLNIVVEERNVPFAFAFGFVVGYFSDSALAKMREVGYLLFGRPESER